MTLTWSNPGNFEFFFVCSVKCTIVFDKLSIPEFLALLDPLSLKLKTLFHIEDPWTRTFGLRCTDFAGCMLI